MRMKEFVWNHDILVIMVPSKMELFVRPKCLQQSEIGCTFAA